MAPAPKGRPISDQRQAPIYFLYSKNLVHWSPCGQSLFVIDKISSIPLGIWHWIQIQLLLSITPKIFSPHALSPAVFSFNPHHIPSSHPSIQIHSWSICELEQESSPSSGSLTLRVYTLSTSACHDLLTVMFVFSLLLDYKEPWGQGLCLTIFSAERNVVSFRIRLELNCHVVHGHSKKVAKLRKTYQT